MGFNSVPNILTLNSKYLQMNDEKERKQYLKKSIWKISVSDGVVTSHKFLDFINKRTFWKVFSLVFYFLLNINRLNIENLYLALLKQ